MTNAQKMEEFSPEFDREYCREFCRKYFFRKATFLNEGFFSYSVIIPVR